MNTAQAPESFREMIARYNRELMDAYRQRPDTSPPAAEKDGDWLDREFPLPDVERDRQRIPVAAMPSVTDDSPEPTVEAVPAEAAIPADGERARPTGEPVFPYTDADLNGRLPIPPEQPALPAASPGFQGYLRVYVSAGHHAEPLAGAQVVVTRPLETSAALIANLVTDSSGLTPVIAVPSVDPALTLTPGIAAPYIAYRIRVSVTGFSTVIFENVPVYGNNQVTQPAIMLPLLPGESEETAVRIFRSQGPFERSERS